VRLHICALTDRAAGQSASSVGHRRGFIWHLAGRPLEQAGHSSWGGWFKMPSRSAVSALRTNQGPLAAIARGLQGMLRVCKDGTVIAAIGRPLPPPGGEAYRMMLFRVGPGWRRYRRSEWPRPDGCSSTAFRSASGTHGDIPHHAGAVGLGDSPWAPFPRFGSTHPSFDACSRGVDRSAGVISPHVSPWKATTRWRAGAGTFNRADGQIEQACARTQSLHANASQEFAHPVGANPAGVGN